MELYDLEMIPYRCNLIRYGASKIATNEKWIFSIARNNYGGDNPLKRIAISQGEINYQELLISVEKLPVTAIVDIGKGKQKFFCL